MTSDIHEWTAVVAECMPGASYAGYAALVVAWSPRPSRSTPTTAPSSSIKRYRHRRSDTLLRPSAVETWRPPSCATHSPSWARAPPDRLLVAPASRDAEARACHARISIRAERAGASPSATSRSSGPARSRTLRTDWSVPCGGTSPAGVRVPRPVPGTPRRAHHRLL